MGEKNKYTLLPTNNQWPGSEDISQKSNQETEANSECGEIRISDERSWSQYKHSTSQS